MDNDFNNLTGCWPESYFFADEAGYCTWHPGATRALGHQVIHEARCFERTSEAAKLRKQQEKKRQLEQIQEEMDRQKSLRIANEKFERAVKKQHGQSTAYKQHFSGGELPYDLAQKEFEKNAPAIEGIDKSLTEICSKIETADNDQGFKDIES